MRLKDLIRRIALVFLGPRWVDLDAKPYAIANMAVKEHRKKGFYRFNPDKVSFFVSEKQKEGRANGPELMLELADKSVFNANLLDHLLCHPKLIPKIWESKSICFWGTIYESITGDLVIRYLFYNSGKWFCGLKHLSLDFYSADEALIAA